MNKQELQKKYQEIVLKTNGGNEDYVVALCQISNAINELEDTKDLQSQLDQQKAMWKKLREFIANEIDIINEEKYNKNIDKHEIEEELCKIADKMEEIEKGEKDEK